METQQIETFARVLRRLGGLFMQTMAQQSAAHETLSKQELLAISVLNDQGPCRMGDIAESLGVGQSAVTPLVDRLEAQGLAARVRSDVDRRVWLVELSEEGREVFGADDVGYQRVAQRMLAPLSDAERETLVALLSRIVSVA